MFDVLLPVFNGEKTIKKTLDSISAQKALPTKVVIIIDGCNDGTEQIVDEYIEKNILNISKIVLKKNQGIVAALNKGLENCKSSWVARVDADDYWLPDHLSSIRDAIRVNKLNIGLIASTAKIVKDDKITHTTLSYKDQDLRKALIKDNPFVHSSVAYKLKAVIDTGGYRNLYKYEDYDLWIRLLSKYRGEIIDSQTCVHVKSDDSLTKKYSFNNILEERLKVQFLAFKEFGFVSFYGPIFIILSSLRLIYRKFTTILFRKLKF